MSRKIVILTEGYTDPHRAKTAISLIRYCREEILAVLDKHSQGRSCQDMLGVGGDLPIVASIEDVPGADTLLLGIAPPGGRLPVEWRSIILEAIARRMDVVSGMHEFLCDDEEFVRVAENSGARLVDVRRNDEHEVATGQGLREECLRIHTVGNTSSCGKMVAAVEITNGLKDQGVDAKFVATGQSGIMVEGDGCPIDCVVADFIAGAAERLVRANQNHEVIVVEGQGSLIHPRYSGVTLGLLHGLRPDGLILCYHMGRETVFGMDDHKLPSLERVLEFNEMAANFMHPCKMIGISVNGRNFSDEEVADECEKVAARLGLPACDVIRQGPDKLVAAVLDLKRRLGK
ncbi:MAG: DUF1611 domain-containing protein [Pirellulales bacterium]|nr:DUF1611 domain-containing protein [Pirellulales bacterium]